MNSNANQLTVANSNLSNIKHVLARKDLLLLIAFNFIASFIYAQPQKFSYQAVVRNSAGVPAINQSVSLRFSVRDLTASGNVQYSETQTATTNAFGLVNVQVGTGTVVSGSFSAITWSTGSKFLKVEADMGGGSNYTVLGTNELTSVPFALYAPPPPITGGTIIPFASGGSMALSSAANSGASTSVAYLAFGSSASISGISAINAIPYTVVMPRAGTITSMAGYFTNIGFTTLSGAVTVTAQLYQAVGTGGYTAIPEAIVTLSPALSGTITTGVPSAAGITNNLNIVVAAQTRLLMVYSITSVGATAVNNLSGFGSAAINIQ